MVATVTRNVTVVSFIRFRVLMIIRVIKVCTAIRVVKVIRAVTVMRVDRGCWGYYGG
jgi:hypothetical protein